MKKLIAFTLIICIVVLTYPRSAYAAVAIATSATSSGTVATTAAVTMPASVASGDLLIFCIGNVEADTGSSNPSTPANWTERAAVTDGFNNSRIECFSKISDGGEGASVTVTLNGTAQWTALAMRITGYHPTAYIDATATTNSATSGNSTMTAPSITTVTANTLIIRVGHTRETSAISNPASHTDVGEVGTGTTSDHSRMQVSSIAQAAIGASGTAAFSATASDREYSTVTMAIAENAAPIEQQVFRFRNDDGSESTATWKAAENTDITETTLTNVRLRMQASTTGDTASSPYRLEFKEDSESTYKPVGTTTPLITYVASSTPVASTDDTADVAYPSNVREGDLLVMAVSTKATTTRVTTPSGWELITNSMGEHGSAAADTGGARMTVLVKEADGTETGTLTVTVTGDNVTYAQMTAFRKGTGQRWAYEGVGANDSAGNSTSWSAATTTTITVQQNDLVYQASGFNTDAYSYSSQAVAITGATFSTLQEIEDGAGTGSGQDTDMNISTHLVSSAGEVTGAPTFTMTSSSSGATTPAGGTVMLRIRQVDAPIQLKSTSNITDTGEDTTAQLSVPNGKSFTAGRINDTENPSDAVDIASDRYTEWEWNLIATTTASYGDVYQFRVTSNGTVFTTYTDVPQWTITAEEEGATLTSPLIILRAQMILNGRMLIQ